MLRIYTNEWWYCICIFQSYTGSTNIKLKKNACNQDSDLETLTGTFCGTSKAKHHIGITLSVTCLSVCHALLLLVQYAFHRKLVYQKGKKPFHVFIASLDISVSWTHFIFSQVKGGDNQEKLVYQIIKEAGNKGIWIRDIRYKCNLLLTQVNKILKNLESKKLIKAVKSVAVSVITLFLNLLGSQNLFSWVKESGSGISDTSVIVTV